MQCKSHCRPNLSHTLPAGSTAMPWIVWRWSSPRRSARLSSLSPSHPQHKGRCGRASVRVVRPARLRPLHPPRRRRTHQGDPHAGGRSGGRVASGAGARSSSPLPGSDPLGVPGLQHADGDALALRPPMRDVSLRRPAEREPAATDPAGPGAPLGAIAAVTTTLRLRGRCSQRGRDRQGLHARRLRPPTRP